ncbi:MAG: hypothetical protein DWQ07_25915 [Chloroflexi bacterium]|nr:MAG: hypothetical protein DWQ07_25915 [Chloroflexota bacterium]
MSEMGETRGIPLAPIAEYANKLKEWDSNIVEVIAIAVLAEARNEKIDLVCKFDPEPEGNVIGFFWIANLIVRDEFEDLSKTLGIDRKFDIGLQIGNTIYLPQGDTLKPGEYIQLWPQNE